MTGALSAVFRRAARGWGAVRFTLLEARIDGELGGMSDESKRFLLQARSGLLVLVHTRTFTLRTPALDCQPERAYGNAHAISKP